MGGEEVVVRKMVEEGGWVGVVIEDRCGGEDV